MSMLLIFIYFCAMLFGDVHVWATWTSPNNIAQKYIKMSNMDITKKHSTEIYKDELFGDVHVAHLYIFLCYVFWWCPCCSSLYISVLCFLVMSMLLIFMKYIKMSNMDITKQHNTEIYKDEQHGYHQKT
jgi:hypothetical protein